MALTLGLNIKLTPAFYPVKRSTERKLNVKDAKLILGTMRAIAALQVAAIEWGDDDSKEQSEARQALKGMTEALNQLHLNFARMQRASESIRHSK